MGTKRFIHEARRARKLLGGGMRQAGVIAAAGVVALSEMIERLVDDHTHAQQLASGLSGLGFQPLHPVETNIVYFGLPEGYETSALTARWREQGLLINPSYGGACRAVTHYGITPEDVDQTLTILAESL